MISVLWLTKRLTNPRPPVCTSETTTSELCILLSYSQMPLFNFLPTLSPSFHIVNRCFSADMLLKLLPQASARMGQSAVDFGFLFVAIGVVFTETFREASKRHILPQASSTAVPHAYFPVTMSTRLHCKKMQSSSVFLLLGPQF